MKGLIYIAIATAVSILTGCSTVTCPMDTIVLCNYDFYDADGNAIRLNDALTVLGKKGDTDTVLVNSLMSGTGFSIPMSYYNPVDTLILRYQNIIYPDTIYVHHDGYTKVETPECGSYRFHNIREINHTYRSIDHIEVINPSVNYEGEKNVKIYFNTTLE